MPNSKMKAGFLVWYPAFFLILSVTNQFTTGAFP